MFILNIFIILTLISIIKQSTEDNKFITCPIEKISKIAAFITECKGLLICYQSQLESNSEKNYKFNKRFEVTKKSEGKGVCQQCVEDNNCAEGIEWRGVRIFYKGKKEKSVSIQADIFKNGEKQQLKGIRREEFITFLLGDNEKINIKVINSNSVDKAFYTQTKEFKSQAPPLLDDYAGVIALKLDITFKNDFTPIKYTLAKIIDKNCKLNNTKTT